MYKYKLYQPLMTNSELTMCFITTDLKLINVKESNAILIMAIVLSSDNESTTDDQGGRPSDLPGAGQQAGRPGGGVDVHRHHRVPHQGLPRLPQPAAVWLHGKNINSGHT